MGFKSVNVIALLEELPGVVKLLLINIKYYYEILRPGGDGLTGATPEDAADWSPQDWLEEQLEEGEDDGVTVTDVHAHLSLAD